MSQTVYEIEFINEMCRERSWEFTLARQERRPHGTALGDEMKDLCLSLAFIVVRLARMQKWMSDSASTT